MQLRPYQTEAIDAISEAEARGVRKLDFIGKNDGFVMAELLQICYTKSSRAEEVLAYFPALSNNRKVTSVMTCQQGNTFSLSVQPYSFKFPVPGGVYAIHNTVNHKLYVGSAVNLQKRLYEHIRRLRKGNHHNIRLQSDFNFFGESVFTYEVVEYVSIKEEIVKREQYFIDLFNAAVSGYNITPKAETRLGSKFSLKSRQLKSRQAREYYEKHPEARIAFVERMKRYRERDPDFDARRGAKIKEKYKCPDYSAQASDRQREVQNRPEVREIKSAKKISEWKDPQKRKSHCDALRIGKKKYYAQHGVTYKGVTASVTEFADQVGLKRNTVHGRLFKGWTIEEALEIPLGGSRKKKEGAQ